MVPLMNRTGTADPRCSWLAVAVVWSTITPPRVRASVLPATYWGFTARSMVAVSTAATAISKSWNWARAYRCRVTVSTPDTDRTAVVTSAPMGWLPLAEMRKSAPNVEVTSRLTDAVSDAASTVLAATSATPIINAAAVAPVRRGLRMALRWLSVPTPPYTYG